MPSFVELVFSAVGTEAAADAVEHLNEKLGDEVRELGRMATATLTAESAFESFKEVVEEGVMFDRLSARTGQPVRDLVILRKAFEEAGLGAENVGASANLLQKALSGLNEMGGRTDIAFKRLGTSIEELRPLSYAEQLNELSKGFSSITNPSDRAALAMQIFGRAGGEMMGILGNSNAIEDATASVGALADRLQADAPKFREADNHFDDIKNQFHLAAVVATEQLLPVLKNIADVIRSIDLTSIGAFVGGSIPIVLGTGLATKTISMLDNAALDWATRKGEPIGQAFAGRFVAPITGALSRAIPLALAVGITAGIVKGITDAIKDNYVQSLLQQTKKVSEVVEPATKDAGGVRSSAYAALEKARIDSQRAEIEKHLVELRGHQAEAQRNQRLMALMVPGGMSPVDTHTKGILARSSEIEVLERQKAALDDLSKNLSDPAKVAAAVAANRLQDIQESIKPLVNSLVANEEKNQQLKFDNMTPEEQAGFLASKREGLEDEQKKAMPAGLSETEIHARNVSLENQILEIKVKERELQAKLLEDAKKLKEEEQKRVIYALETQMIAAKAAGNETLAQKFKEEIDQKRALMELSGKDLDLAKERAAAEHKIWEVEQARIAAKKQIDSERVVLEAQLNVIKETIARVGSDYTNSEVAKWQYRQELIAKEIKQLQTIADIETTRAAAARASGGAGEEVALLHEGRAREANRDISGLRQDSASAGANPFSIGEQMKSQMTQFENSIPTVAQGLAGAFKSAADSMRTSLGGALDDMLFKGKGLGAGMASVGMAIVDSMEKSGTQMAADWFMQHMIMDNVRRLFHIKGVAEQATESTVKVGIVAGEEGVKTGAAAAGAAARSGIAVTEATTVASTSGIAGVFRSIMELGPIAGPIVFASAIGGMIALISSLIPRETGGPVRKGRSYLVGEKRPEVFVPESDGYIFPDAANFSMPAVPSSYPGASPTSLRSAAQPSAAASNALGGSHSRESAKNHYWYVDRKQWIRDSREDIAGIAGEVFDQMARS